MLDAVEQTRADRGPGGWEEKKKRNKGETAGGGGRRWLPLGRAASMHPHSPILASIAPCLAAYVCGVCVVRCVGTTLMSGCV